jgi:hypothetical protein
LTPPPISFIVLHETQITSAADFFQLSTNMAMVESKRSIIGIMQCWMLSLPKIEKSGKQIFDLH